MESWSNIDRYLEQHFVASEEDGFLLAVVR
jgi:hypothetical protein